MTHHDDIEQQLSELKKHYKVPDNYFENFQISPDNLNKTQPESFSKKVWLVAALIILLVSLGYKVVKWTQKSSETPIPAPKQFAQSDDLFNDLTEEEIIDYLIDENVIDQF